MELVKEGQTADLGFKHNGSLSMKKNLPRPGFLKTMGEPVNDMRFGHSDNYDRSTYLTTVPRVKSLVPFQGLRSREEALIAKGGDTLVDLEGK